MVVRLESLDEAEEDTADEAADDNWVEAVVDVWVEVDSVAVVAALAATEIGTAAAAVPSMRTLAQARIVAVVKRMLREAKVGARTLRDAVYQAL